MNIDKVRSSNGFMRTVASIVLVTYSTLVVSPGVQAMQNAEAQETARQQARQEERVNFGKSLAGAREMLRVLADRPDGLDRRPRREGKRGAKEALRAWRGESGALIAQVRSEFASTGALLERRGLPEEIKRRHAATLAKFEAEISAFERDLNEAVTTTDAAVETARAEAALRRLDRGELGRSQQEFRPESLPNDVLKPNRARTPMTTLEAFQTALLLDNPNARFAQATGFDLSQLPGAANPSYLQASTEVVLTPDIQAKADELNRNPVAIYNWVRNNVYWQPTWGALQDASHTLSSLRGNAFDISSLTIALLRASGVPARYVHGTIDVPEEQFRNWSGGFQNVDAAMDFVSAGGIPVVAVTTGGRITKVRIEHVWVEAAVDFHPSRGVKNRAADNWIPMDPSFKQVTISSGVDVAAVTGFDAQPVVDAIRDNLQVDPTNGSLTGLDPTAVRQALSQSETALRAHIRDEMPDATVYDLVGGKRIIQRVSPVLAASLPTRIVVAGARFASIPASLQQQITFGFGRDIEGEPVLARSFPWASVNGKEVSLSFAPASPADEATLRSYFPDNTTDPSQLPTSIPAYLINVLPELKVNGEVVLRGSAMTLGHDLEFAFDPRFVHSGVRPFTYKVPAGSHLAVAAIAGSVSPQSLSATRARIEQTRAVIASGTGLDALTKDRVLGDVYQLGMLGYYAHYISMGYNAGLDTNGFHQLAAGLGTFGYEPKVDTFFGIPRNISRGALSLNIPIVNVVGHTANDAAAKRAFTINLGVLSSNLEHQVPEQMFTPVDGPRDGISAVKALMLASAAGQPVYEITAANRAVTMPSIHLDPDTMAEIEQALSAGKVVTTHPNPVSVPGWTGAGYIIMDAETGAAAWKISGGLNGGSLSFFDNNSGPLGLVAFVLSVAAPHMALTGLLPMLVPMLAIVLTFAILAAGLILFIDSLDGTRCDDAMLALYVSLQVLFLALGFAFGGIPLALFMSWIWGWLADGMVRSAAPACRTVGQ